MWLAGNARGRSLGAGAGLILVLAILAVALFSPAGGFRRTSVSPRGTEAASGWLGSGPVYAIVLPYEEPPEVPPGPNREQFTALCRLCHSPRLVLTQPRLTDKQWGDIVRKMVAVYDAPIPPEAEPDILAYLKAVRGPEPTAPTR